MKRAALLFLALVALLSFAAPLFGLDPYRIDPDRIYAPPSLAHWLGTDDAGRDLLARLLYGGRVSLSVAALGALLVVLAGAGLGLAAGWYGGLLDRGLLRLIEVVMAVPKLPLMLLLAAVEPVRHLGLGRELGSIVSVASIVALFGWPASARLARSSALEARARDYVTAARALGLSDLAVLRRHVLPAALGPLSTAAAVSIGDIILYESMLSFLGLGVQAPVPSWGAMLSRGLLDLVRAPLAIVLPGLLTLAVVLAFQVASAGHEQPAGRRRRRNAVGRRG